MTRVLTRRLERMRDRGRPRSTRGRVLVTLAGAAQIGSAVLAWRDLKRRTDDQVRGNRRLWRAAVAIGPGNSLSYWLVGRRGGSSPRLGAPG